VESDPGPLGQLDQLRRSIRTRLRALGWLKRWRSESPQPWDRTQAAHMSANAVELSALTDFVALHREPEAAPRA
jgi:6-phosphofructokinase